jgi:ketosteroid isomerase-like protein
MPQTNESAVRDLLERWAAAVRAKNTSEVLANHSQDIRMFDVPPPSSHGDSLPTKTLGSCFIQASPTRLHLISSGWRLLLEMMSRSLLRTCNA